MTTVHYEARTHRLRIEGACRDDARSTIHEALETCAPLAEGRLIVDLTGVTGIDQSVADELVAVARSVTDDDTLTFVRKNGTPVDRVLTLAEARGQGRAGSRRPG